MKDITALRERLQAVGQEHLLAFHGELSEAGRSQLVGQIEAIDLESLPRLIETYMRNKPVVKVPDRIEPAPYFPFEAASKWRPWDKVAMRAAGAVRLAAWPAARARRPTGF